MKFLELNKKRHEIKHFTDQPVDPKDVRTAIEIATFALFTDTDLQKRARKNARVGGVKNFTDEQLQYFMQNLPAEFARYDAQQTSDYLALNAGLVAMNLVLALTDQGIGTNIILGFDKSKINEVLDIEERFRPEVLITVGYAAEKVEPSYRLPVDEIIDKR